MSYACGLSRLVPAATNNAWLRSVHRAVAGCLCTLRFRARDAPNEPRRRLRCRRARRRRDRDSLSTSRPAVSITSASLDGVIGACGLLPNRTSSASMRVQSTSRVARAVARGQTRSHHRVLRIVGPVLTLPGVEADRRICAVKRNRSHAVVDGARRKLARRRCRTNHRTYRRSSMLISFRFCVEIVRGQCGTVQVGPVRPSCAPHAVTLSSVIVFARSSRLPVDRAGAPGAAVVHQQQIARIE